MCENDELARRFDAQRSRLRAIATQLLGSVHDADDAIQEAWLRLQRTNVDEIQNLDAWLATVVSHIGLDMLRAPRRARERSWEVEAWRDEPRAVDADPAEIIAESDRVGVALLVVLETMSPAERIAFVLHDVFGQTFDEIATTLERSPAAVRQLASRGRRRIRDAPEPTAVSRRQERRLVDAWLDAVQCGDLSALLGLLDEDAVLHADFGEHTQMIVGADQIAAQALVSRRLAAHSVPVFLDGTPGVAAVMGGRVVSLMKFTILHDQITELHVLADPQRLRGLQPMEWNRG